MWKDAIVEEIRKVRDAHAMKFNHDVEAIVLDLDARDKKSGRRLYSFRSVRRLPSKREQN